MFFFYFNILYMLNVMYVILSFICYIYSDWEAPFWSFSPSSVRCFIPNQGP